MTDSVPYDPTTLVILLVVTFIGYFLPFLVALIRGHRQRVAILVLNLLLGWTFIGWVVALVWSFTKSAPAVTDPPS